MLYAVRREIDELNAQNFINCVSCPFLRKLNVNTESVYLQVMTRILQGQIETLI